MKAIFRDQILQDNLLKAHLPSNKQAGSVKERDKVSKSYSIAGLQEKVFKLQEELKKGNF